MARRRRNGSMGWKIIIAILAFIGMLFIIDKLAGTQLLQTLWDKFISFIKWIATLAGGVK
ncbi:MAG: hypothetical protein J7K47_03550 [Thermoplasmata archaeon]|nr:hypothetical protein [Thermoplasmata archaeon]